MKFTVAYTLLFVYVVSAIVFWGISLNKQAKVVYELEMKNIENQQLNIGKNLFEEKVQKIKAEKNRRKKQYTGEGATFLAITLIASSLIYIAYYRQLKLSQLQQNFMLSITHELKTPIAGIKLNMQTLEKHHLQEDIRNKLVKATITESNRLNDLCNNILLATQLESKRKTIYSENIILNDLIEEEIKEFQIRYNDLCIETHFDITHFEFKGEMTLWKLVLSNLIENARKYSTEEKKIKISLLRKNQQTLLCIADNGIGIADEEKENIFKKFYRVGNENTRNSKGTGLGLYLVKKIVDIYKYDITVKNNLPKGTIFEINFRA